MTRLFRIAFLGVLVIFQSCIVTERMIVNDDGSGDFEVVYDLSNMSEIMADMMPAMGDDDVKDDYEDNDDDDYEEMEEDSMDESEAEKAGEVVDTLIVFDDLFVQFKDSIAALPEKDRKTLENLRGMYMRMNVNEPEKQFKMGIGMAFTSFDDLRDIQKRVKEARDLNSRDSGVDNMTENSPFSGLMGNEEDDVIYEWTPASFRRTTVINRDLDSLSNVIKEMENGDGDFKDTFKESTYQISYTFSKRIKSTTIEDAEISEDRKTITYSASWIKYLSDPRMLDVFIEFEDE